MSTIDRRGDHHDLTGKYEERAGTRPAGSLAVMTDLSGDDPSSIDERLAAAYQRIGTARRNLDFAERELERAEKSGMPSRIADAKERFAKAERASDLVAFDAVPYEQEFKRRGGWTRAFLVTGPGGHVHSSTSCSTCRDTTDFMWLTSYSGRSEDDIVSDAGEAACTVCYPSAPVDVLSRPSKIEHPDIAKARAEKEARAQELAAKRAAKIAAQVPSLGGGYAVKPDGEIAKSERSLELALVDFLYYGESGYVRKDLASELAFIDSAHWRTPEWRAREKDRVTLQYGRFEASVEDLAAARGITPEELHATIRAKAVKRDS